MASFGEKLRRERELRGVDLHEIAESTKISVRFLKALEQDRVDVLPGGLFRKAFVRQYAEHLGLDADRFAADFVAEHRREEEASQPAPVDRVPRRPRRWKPLLAAAGVVGAAAAYSHFELGKEPTPPLAAVPTAITLPPDPVYPPPAAEASEDTSEGLVLTISARQNCWVAVEVDGAPVLNRTLRRGETEVVEAEGEIVMSVGNAGGLAFKVNDRPGLSLGADGEVRKNIVITRQSLSSLVEEAPPVRTSHSS